MNRINYNRAVVKFLFAAKFTVIDLRITAHTTLASAGDRNEKE